MASSADINEAFNRGRSAGQNQAMGKQPRIPTAAMYNTYLGPSSSDPELRAAFDNGFYTGYDETAKGLGGVVPGAESTLSKITKAEQAKADNPFGARQTELDLNYQGFDNTVQAEKAGYVAVPGGLSFLSDWQILKGEWQTSNANALNESYLEYYEQKLAEMKERRAGLGSGTTTYSTSETSIPATWETLPPWEAPPAGMATTATNKPTLAAPSSAAAGKILGLPKPVVYVGAALILIGGIGAAVVVAKKDDEEKKKQARLGLPPPGRI